MLMITSFANPRVAQAFVDYMATQGVILTIQQHHQSDVWLADETQAERVHAELARPAGSRVILVVGCVIAASRLLPHCVSVPARSPG